MNPSTNKACHLFDWALDINELEWANWLLNTESIDIAQATACSLS